MDWINQRSPEALSTFLIWSLDSILADLGSQQNVAKGSKKAVQQVSSKSQVLILYTLLCQELVFFPLLIIIG